MLRYTNKDYQKEMIEYRGNMPRNWIAKYINDEHPGIDDKARSKLASGLLNTLAGYNHKKGISQGYVNAIRKAWSDHNGVKYVELPKEVLTYE